MVLRRRDYTHPSILVGQSVSLARVIMADVISCECKSHSKQGCLFFLNKTLGVFECIVSCGSKLMVFVFPSKCQGVMCDLILP